jgi:hypothetical protein
MFNKKLSILKNAKNGIYETVSVFQRLLTLNHMTDFHELHVMLLTDNTSNTHFNFLQSVINFSLIHRVAQKNVYTLWREKYVLTIKDISASQERLCHLLRKHYKSACAICWENIILHGSLIDLMQKPEKYKSHRRGNYKRTQCQRYELQVSSASNFSLFPYIYIYTHTYIYIYIIKKIKIKGGATAK